MNSGWRGGALIAGVILAACGVALWSSGGGPFLLIAAAVVLVTAALEPIYGRAAGRPTGRNWQPTDEKFVDPETGKLVTVWFDARSGERRYVDE